MRLIDADAAMARIAPIIKSAATRNRERFETARRCAEIINTAPTAGIEIVRCRDCKNYWQHGGGCISAPDWFCGDGRKA